MKKLYSTIIFAISLVASVNAATIPPKTNIVIVLSPISLNATQFSLSLPLTITNLDSLFANSNHIYFGIFIGTNIGVHIGDGSGLTNIIAVGTNTTGTNGFADYLIKTNAATGGFTNVVGPIQFFTALTVNTFNSGAGTFRSTITNGLFIIQSGTNGNNIFVVSTNTPVLFVDTNGITHGYFAGDASALTNLPTTGPYILKDTGSGTNTTLRYSTNIFGSAFVGPANSGTITIGDYTQHGLASYFGNTKLWPDTQGLLVFARTSPDGYYFTSGWNDNQGGVENIGLRTYFKNNKIVDGATVTAWNDLSGGDVSGATGLPSRGTEIWKNQKYGNVVLTSRGDLGANNLVNCTEVNMSNSIAMFRTNGTLAALTNLGVTCVYEAEGGWLTNHRDSVTGVLRWNTNRWPMQTAFQTNFANFVTTNGMEPWLMMYADTVTPSAANTEWDTDISGNNTWEYPNGVNFTTGEIQPILTPDKSLLDISTFYRWNVSGLTFQDSSPLNSFSSGYLQQRRHKIAYDSLNPYGATINTRAPWRYWYPNRFHGHGMILNYLVVAGSPFSEAAEFDSNGLAIESLGNSTEPCGGVICQIMSNIRPYLHALTNWSAATTHFIPQSDSIFINYAWGWDEWRNYLSGIAMFDTDEWLTTKHDYLTNSSYRLAQTNADFLAIWRDPLQNRVEAINVGITNSIFKKTLYDGTKAVWFVNEDNFSVSTNLTVSWNDLGFKSNNMAYAIQMWSNNLVLGKYTNSFTINVSASDSRLIKFYQPGLGSGENLTNVPVYFNATTIWVDPNGNDSTGLRGSKDYPFKSIYNCQDTNAHTFYGALTVAQAGDTIFVMPGITYAPAVPLNLTSTGINLYVSAGATLIRTNKYYKQDGTIQNQMVGNATVGAFIIPGNRSSIIVDGQIIATNEPGHDAAFGWSDSRDTTTPFYGYTNKIATNVVISGLGKIITTYDGVYFNQTNIAISSVFMSSLSLTGLYDNIYINGNCDLVTKNLYSLVGTADAISRGVTINSGGDWTDYGSSFGCGGAATTYPLYAGPGTSISFYGTRLYVLTQNTLQTNNPGGSVSQYFYWPDPNSFVDGDFTYTDENGRSDHVYVGISGGPVGNGAGLTNLPIATNIISSISSNVFFGNGLSGKRVVIFQANNAPSSVQGQSLGWVNSFSGGNQVYNATATTQCGSLIYSGTAGAANYMIENSGLPFIPSKSPGFFEFRAAITNLSDVRVWIGLSGQTATFFYNSETPPNNCAIFKYSTNSPNWFFYTTGSGTTTKDTGVAATTNLTALKVVMDGGTSIVAYINSVPVATNSTTANLPNAALTPVFINCPLVSSGKGLIIYSLYGEQPWQ